MLNKESPTLPSSFAALGDANRFSIVEMLLAEGEKPAGAICDRTSISAPAVSRHLKILTNAGLIERRVDKQRRLYAVSPAKFGEINDWLQRHIAFWEGSLDRLQAAVEKGPLR